MGHTYESCWGAESGCLLTTADTATAKIAVKFDGLTDPRGDSELAGTVYLSTKCETDD